MSKKNNIRSIRFSDELAKLIDQQVGQTFTEKFENLVTRCVWELPQKEKELKQLDEEIQRKREEYKEMRSRLWQLSETISNLEVVISREFQKWEP